MFGNTRIGKANRVVKTRNAKLGRIAETNRKTHKQLFYLNTPVLKKYFTDLSGLVRYEPNDDAAGSMVPRVVNPAFPVGNERLIDGSMEAVGVSAYIAGAAATLTKDTSSPHSGTKNLRVARSTTNDPNANQQILTIGKMYHTTGWCKSDGNAIPRVLASFTAFTGTTSTSWQAFDFYFIATNAQFSLQSQTSTGTQYTEWDDVSVKQVDIKASYDFPSLEQLKNNDFDYPLVAWPAATNWTQSGSKITHTTGSVVALTQTASIVITRTYDVVVVVSGRTAGSVTPRAGSSGTGGSAISANGASAIQTLTCAGNSAFALVPTTDFNGSIESVSLVPHSGLLVLDGGFETWTNSTTPTNWTKTVAGTSSVNQETVLFDTGSNALRMDIDASGDSAQVSQTILKTGSTYMLTIRARGSSSSATITTDSGVFAGALALTTSYATYVFAGAASTTIFNLKSAVASTSVYIDNVSLIEIAPMSNNYVNGAAPGHVSSQPLVVTDVAFDGVNDAIAQNSGDFKSVWSPTSFTLSAFAEVTNAGVWTDATNRYIIRRGAGSSRAGIAKSTTNNTITFLYTTSTVDSQINVTFNSLGIHLYTMTVNVQTDLMIAYIDGLEVGRLSGLGVWLGNLISSEVVFGAAQATTGALGWSGWLAHALDLNRAATASEILTWAQLGGLVN